MKDHRNEKTDGRLPYKIRYVNIDIVFDYLLKNNNKALDIKKRKELTLSDIERNDSLLSLAADTNEKDELLKSRKQYYADLDEIIKDEEHYKNIFLNQIDNALKVIAKKSDVDFVLNIGEGVVYSRKEYDITEELLREVIKQKQKSAPVTR